VSGRSPAAGATAAIPGHAWAVQLGSFASHDNAEKLLRQMKAQGFSVYVLSGGRGASLRYRVRIGPMADRGAAAQVVAKLKAAGHIGSLVPPAP
jgi:DedD protein